MQKIQSSLSLAIFFSFAVNGVAHGALYTEEYSNNHLDIIPPPTIEEEELLFDEQHLKKVSQTCKDHSVFGAPIIWAEEGETFATFRFLGLPNNIICTGTDREGITLSRFDIKTLLNKTDYISEEVKFYTEEALAYYRDIIGWNALLKADRALDEYSCTPYERIQMHFTFSNPFKEICP